MQRIGQSESSSTHRRVGSLCWAIQGCRCKYFLSWTIHLPPTNKNACSQS